MYIRVLVASCTVGTTVYVLLRTYLINVVDEWNLFLDFLRSVFIVSLVKSIVNEHKGRATPALARLDQTTSTEELEESRVEYNGEKETSEAATLVGR